MMVRSMLTAFALILAVGSTETRAATAGSVAPDSTVLLANGQSLNFGELRGQVVVLSYWMSDCKACDAQMALLDNYYRQRRDLGLVVLAVPVEDVRDGKLMTAFKGKLVHPVSRLRGPFELLDALPTTYVVDRKGEIRYAASGLLDTERLNQILVPLLKEPQP